MKQHLTAATAWVLFLLLIGCTHSPIPLATSYPISTQQKMQAAYHWDVLAKHLAERLKASVGTTFAGSPTPPPLIVRVSKEQEKTPFGKTFYHLLVNKLVQQGMVVLTNSAGSGTTYVDTLSYANNLVIDYDVQVIQHKDRRLTYPPFGTFTGLATTFWLVAQGVDSWKYTEAAIIPLAAVADIYAAKDYYLPAKTNTEVVINTSATLNQQYIFGSSDIYYVNDGDYDHYEQEQKTYQVVSQ
ncbi:MAG: hypothetical protein BWK79_01610 [Beggiatoa sp. IS2]|nr:MAG: hypothetical protein BWK79_01610 [Beggiatoa sp. IS2]